MDDDDDEFEQFDAEGDELLADDSSEDEDSMQVVRFLSCIAMRRSANTY